MEKKKWCKIPVSVRCRYGANEWFFYKEFSRPFQHYGMCSLYMLCVRMSVCMCVRVYVCVCVCVCIYVCMDVCMYLCIICMYLSINLPFQSVFLYVCLYICLSTHLFICLFNRLSISSCVCICEYVNRKLTHLKFLFVHLLICYCYHYHYCYHFYYCLFNFFL